MKKKSVIVILFSLLYFAVSYAQEPFKRELSIGFGGGVNLSSIAFTPKVDQGKLLGMQGGVTIRWITEKNLGLTAELNYTQQGWKEDFSEITDENGNPTATGYRYSRTINYIEMPFMTHIYFGGKRVRFTINIGPKIGYAISESTDENLNGKEIGRVYAQHDMPIENKLDWGICGGPGIELRTGIGSFLLEGRYYFALGNIYGSQKQDFFPKSNGQVISVRLSYLVNLWK